MTTTSISRPTPMMSQTNTGAGPYFDLIDVGHPDYVALIEADTAFWILVSRREALDYLFGPDLLPAFLNRQAELQQDLDRVRFGLLPAAVYVNPTERCNLNCSYCYLPTDLRRKGKDMSAGRLLEALSLLADFFKGILPEGARPQIVFHGSEPLLAREAVFQGIERFGPTFRFGVQTNATLLDKEARDFLTSRGVSIGISLDGHCAAVADRTRHTWAGGGVFTQVVRNLEELADYAGFNVIATITRENVAYLPELVEFLHRRGVANALLNPVRGTQSGGRALMPDPQGLAQNFFKALDRSYELFEQTGHRLVIGNFANILLGLVAPGARRLMCDISPCGGGRCFFALTATGEVTPCSEFVGFPEFYGGNLFDDPLEEILETAPFRAMKSRRVEDIEPCRRCALRHFCGAPCPAEVYAFRGSIHGPAPLCEFYAAQARYAFRTIADGRLEAFLWPGWQEGLSEIRVI